MKLPSVFFVGDSISMGYDLYLAKYLKGRFKYSRKQGIKEAFWNNGVQMGANGGDSSLVLKYLCSNHIHKEIPKVDYFLFNCGLHDIKTDIILMKKQVSLLKYKKNLLLILKRASRIADYIVWINSTPVDDERHRLKCKDFFRYDKDVLMYNGVAKKVMEHHNVPVIDLYSFIQRLGPDIYTDHVHFKKSIYRKMAKYLADFLWLRGAASVHAGDDDYIIFHDAEYFDND